MNEHNCIKCGALYRDEDVDPYYCKTCYEEKKRIAARIDATVKHNPKRSTVSDLQAFDSQPKVRGFVQVKL